MDEILSKVEYLGFSKNDPIYKALYDILLVLDSSDLSSEDTSILLELLSGTSLEELNQLKEVSEWGEFDYGNAKIGSLVRVKDNVYDSSTGLRHNGRVGFILSISGRKCRIRYAGTRGSSGLAHPIDNLQSPKYGVK